MARDLIGFPPFLFSARVYKACRYAVVEVAVLGLTLRSSYTLFR